VYKEKNFTLRMIILLGKTLNRTLLISKEDLNPMKKFISKRERKRKDNNNFCWKDFGIFYFVRIQTSKKLKCNAV